MFGDDKPRWKLAGYRAMVPALRGKIAEGNGIRGQADIDEAFATTEAALDDVAKRTADTGFIVGDRFTVADLTAAALFGPIAGLSHPDMKLPEPKATPVIEVLQRYENHPTVRWVHGIYGNYRGGPPRG